MYNRLLVQIIGSNKYKYKMEQSIGEGVELFISCRDLKNLNNLYISDPQVFIYEEKDH